jgi:hypothetical protein
MLSRFMIGLAAVVLLNAGAIGAPRVIDTMDDASAWEARPASGVEMRLSNEPGPSGNALRIDYDFTRGSGWAALRRELKVDLPENYRFSWTMRGQGPRNTLEFKLVDDADENVWWVNQPSLAFASEWTLMSLPKRRFSFAWGPSGGKPIPRARWIEFAITSSGGGKGTVWIDDLSIESLEPVRAYTGTPTARASSEAQGTPLSVDAGGALKWTPRADDAEAWVEVDFGAVREAGGVLLGWGGPQASPTGYVLEASEDGRVFSPLATVGQGGASVQVLRTPDARVRSVRLRVTERGAGVSLRRLELLAPEFADDPNAVAMRLARESPKGWWPRAMLGEGVYWTILGASGDQREAMIGEAGEIELDKAGPSLDPVIIEDGRALTWADASRTEQSLLEGDLPIPGVVREHDGLRLGVTGVVDGRAGASTLMARYTLTNTGERERRGTLAVTLRPLQVNPPYQQLNMLGGVAPIGRVEQGADGVVAADGWRVICLTPGAVFGAGGLDAGEIVERLATGRVPTARAVTDERGMASGAWTMPFVLGPGQSASMVLAAPMGPGGSMPQHAASSEAADAVFETALKRTRDAWAEQLRRVRLEFPGEFGRALGESVRANLAYILINRDGPAIQPGSRSYERTWIRDGTLTSAAMLSLGHAAEVGAFLDWYAPFQYDSGKVPCCVDHRGPDPVPEHDSHGQYIHAVLRHFRHTGDSAFLSRHYPRVLLAAAYLQSLREQRMTPAYRDGDEVVRAYYGILPESISHEGYSAKPMHSYWDTLFGVRGMEDASVIAGLMGDAANQRRLAGLHADFQRAMVESMRLAMKHKGIDYIPGCVELGDFDATSTTIAFFPCDQGDVLPREQLVETFERYWRFFERRRDGAEAWTNYTPYEHRIVGAMIHLGWRERAHEVWRWYFTHQRPAAWRHWAEVVWNNEREARFIGDMPHSWCGSDFINSVRLMVAFERGRDGALVIGAGLPLDWVLDPSGVNVDGLETFYGPLRLEARAERGAAWTARFDVGALRDRPAGGVWLWLPEAERIESVDVDGAKAEHVAGQVRIGTGERATRVRVVYREAR